MSPFNAKYWLLRAKYVEKYYNWQFFQRYYLPLHVWFVVILYPVSHQKFFPEEGHKNDQRAETPLLWGKAERVGAVHHENRRLREDLTATFQYLKGAYKRAGEGLFTRACSDRTRGNGFKLKEGRFRLDTRKKFFTLRLVRHWIRLPREAVDAPSLEVFKARLDGALSNLFYCKVPLPMAGGVGLDDL